jgi:hypothetical protein
LPLIVIDSAGSWTVSASGADTSTGGENWPAELARSEEYSRPSFTQVTSTRPPLDAAIRACDEAAAWPASTRSGGLGAPSVSVDTNTCAAPPSAFR